MIDKVHLEASTSTEPFQHFQHKTDYCDPERGQRVAEKEGTRKNRIITKQKRLKLIIIKLEHSSRKKAKI